MPPIKAQVLMSATSLSILVTGSLVGMIVLTRRWLQRAGTGRFKTPVTINTVVDEKNVLERALPKDVEEAHIQACAAESESYTDPRSGLLVFTRLAHLQRGRCCGSMCRHCPYAHANVPQSKKDQQLQQSSALRDVAAAGSSSARGSFKSRVYTKTGDKGTSALFTGERRPKYDHVFSALGTVDELSSHIGVVRAHLEAQKTTLGVNGAYLVVAKALVDIQRRLLDVGSVVATPDANHVAPYNPLAWTVEAEKAIDTLEAPLQPLSSFILPGGGLVSAELHGCRSGCRRAERCVDELLDAEAEKYPPIARECAVYLNRLSDFFFVAARALSNDEIRR